MAYPTAIELAEYCVDAQLIEGFPVDYSPYETALASAIATWEDSTGWRPFLAPDEDEDKVYRTHVAGLLDLRGGYVEITAVTLDDEEDALTEHTDYSPLPDGATPVRLLRLYRYPSQKVTITGRPGYADTCPADVRQALLAFGAAQIATLLNGTGQLIEIRQGDVSYKYAEGSSVNPTTQYAQWNVTFRSAVQRYSRRAFA